MKAILSTIFPYLIDTNFNSSDAPAQQLDGKLQPTINSEGGSNGENDLAEKLLKAVQVGGQILRLPLQTDRQIDR